MNCDRHWRVSLAALICTSLSFGTAAAQSIEALVEQTLLTELAQVYAAGSYTVTPLPVSAAARLKPCAQLTGQVKSKNLYGRVPVHVRCHAPQPWSLYATAQVDVTAPVLVLSRGVARGEHITDDMVSLEDRPMQQRRTQTLTTPEEAIGKIARRSLTAGAILSLNNLAVPMAVEKGERVHILAHSGRVQIQAYGTALASGAVGDQISVRNETSDRIIQPWVLAPGKVSTSPPRH